MRMENGGKGMMEKRFMAEASTSSSSLSKKQKSFEIDQVDRISSLPDAILAHILSFLPTEDAVKTVLLRSFGHLWTSTRSLDFKVSLYNHSSRSSWFITFTHPKNMWLLNFIDQVLLHHGSPEIDKFSLRFDTVLRLSSVCSEPIQLVEKLDSWIYFAVMKKVKLLELDMLGHNLYGPIVCYDLPDFVLKSDSLIDLKLVSCIIRPLGQINMGSLKSLSLMTVSLDKFIMEEILSGCPSLEHLSILRCYGLYKLNVTSTCLKDLVVTLAESETSKLEISCPNIKAITIAGSIGLANIKNPSSVVDATLDFFRGGRYSNDEYENVGLLLEDLSHAKSLTLCDWCILMFTIQELTRRALSSSTRKVVTLKTMLTKWHMFGIASLLKNSPCLEILTIHVEPSATILTSDDVMWLQAMGIYHNNFWTNEEWLRSYDFDGDNFWNSQQYFPCLKNHLKCVKIHGCTENPYLIELVKFLLRCSLVLEEMVINSQHNAMCIQHHQHQYANLPGMSQRLECFPKASDHAAIMFS